MTDKERVMAYEEKRNRMLHYLLDGLKEDLSLFIEDKATLKACYDKINDSITLGGQI